MKTLLLFLAVALVCTSTALAATEQRSINPGETPWTPTEIGANQRVWKQEVTRETESGPQTDSRTFVELATGLHYLRDGQWQESKDEIELMFGGGAAATKAPYQSYFQANINTVGAVRLVLENGNELRTHVAALAFSDETTGQTALIGVVRDSVGVLLPPNSILYADAFAGLRANITYTVEKGAFTQKITVLENADPREWGMNPATTVLQIWSEFVDTPDPKEINVVEVDGLVDHWYDFFDGIRMGRGTAFNTEMSDNRHGAPVAKLWVRENERGFLVENVRYTAIAQELGGLPPLQANLRHPQLDRAAFVAALARPPMKHEKAQRIEPARADARVREKGLVMDYVGFTGSATNQTNYTFRADTTYLISSVANFWKTTTFEGGTVIKYTATNSAVIQTWSNTIFKTSAYRPAIFTSRNDRSVGEDLYLAGAVTNYFGALAIAINNAEVKNIRMSYADTGLHTFGVNLHDAVFTHCNWATYLEFNPCEVNNVLFYDCQKAFGGSRFKATARQITAHKITALTDDWAKTNAVTNTWVVFTNSLFSQITSNGVAAVTNWYSATDDGASVFKNVGAGSHYLADDSPHRGAGTLEIPEWLATNLAQRTTFAPMLWTNAITEDTTFEPVVQRGGESGDLGYMYPALDYLLSAITVTNCTLTVMPGTAIAAFGTNAFTIRDGAALLSQGISCNVFPALLSVRFFRNVERFIETAHACAHHADGEDDQGQRQQ